MPEEQMKGIPEGVKVLEDYFPAGPNDFELIRNRMEVNGVVTITTEIYKGVRQNSATGIKVMPMEGWTFVQDGWEQFFDILQYKQVQGRPRFVVSKLIPPKTVTVTAKFQVGNEKDLAALEEAIKGVEGMPGYVEQSRVDS